MLLELHKSSRYALDFGCAGASHADRGGIAWRGIGGKRNDAATAVCWRAGCNGRGGVGMSVDTRSWISVRARVAKYLKTDASVSARTNSAEKVYAAAPARRARRRL